MFTIRRVAVAIIAIFTLTLTLTAAAQEDATPIVVGDEVSGTLADSVDKYAIDLVAGDVIVIDLYSTDFEPAVSVEDASGFGVESAFGSDTRSSLVFIAPEDGTYLLVAGEFMGETNGAYTMRVRASQPLEADTEATGDMDNGPVAFTFTGTAGALLSVSYTANDYDGEVYLYDLAGETLASKTEFSSSEPAVMEYVLPEDGTYVLEAGIWFAEEVAFGTYAISYSEIIPNPIEVDSPVTVAMAGTARQYYAFGGNTGQVLHITADSGTTEDVDGYDVDLVVTGPDGTDVFTDSSDGPFDDPAITRVILPEDGFYLIKMIPNDESDESQAGDVVLSVETAELLTFDEGPVTVEVGSTFEQDVVRFTGEPGAQYRLTVTSERPIVSFTVSIGQSLFSSRTLTVSNGDQAILDFTMPEDSEAGLVDVSIRQSSFQDPTNFTLSLEPAG